MDSNARSARQIKPLAASILLLPALSACGVVAAPCRVSSALIDMVPVVGHPLATPTDTCADVIDPKSTGEH